ncbi:MAG: hypothetical protein IPO71_10900 [Nitrosomonas sp.]|nr:hypothetical protein [Nitrosomonas sp.]
MRNLFAMIAVAVVFMATDASATALPPVNTNDVSPSWVASGSREVTYASNSLRYVTEINVPNFKTQALCEDYIIAQEVMAVNKSALGNAGKQVFSAICSKQR